MTEQHRTSTEITPEDAELRLPWSRSERPIARRVLQPLQAFLAAEVSGALLLLLAAIAALAWANIAPDSYDAFWHTEAGLVAGSFELNMDVRKWVNEGLMTLFFFVVGLEIKRELTTGELRTVRAAALPALAALGGMVVPALVYVIFNGGTPAARGWGIPTATDIAFAVAVLTVAGRGLPAGLRAFLLALAIADDIGAIIVIALFYSHGVSLTALAAAAGLFLFMVAANRAHVRAMSVYVLLGAGVWLATLFSGVHATIAGVALGLASPAVAFQRPRAVSREAERVAAETKGDPSPPDADASLWLRLANLSKEAVSPLVRMEEALHPWSSFVVVPLFALANAGVRLDGFGEALGSPVFWGIVAGLVLGKAAGVVGAVFAAVRLRLATLPEGVEWREIAAVGATAGIGFTVSLFIADLAFPRDVTATAAILTASLAAGFLATLLLRRAARLRRTGEQPAAGERPRSGQEPPR